MELFRKVIPDDSVLFSCSQILDRVPNRERSLKNAIGLGVSFVSFAMFASSFLRMCSAHSHNENPTRLDLTSSLHLSSLHLDAVKCLTSLHALSSTAQRQPSTSVHSVQQRDTRSPREKFSAFIKTIADSIDIALLLKSPIFILFTLSNFFTSIGKQHRFHTDMNRKQK